MRASSVFIILIVLDAFLFFGMQSYGLLTGSSPTGLLGDSPFLHYVQYNKTTASIDYSGEGFNATTTEESTLWTAEQGIQVSSSANEVNFATLAWDFINLMIGLVAAPFIFVQLSGIGPATFGIAYIFAVGYLAMMIFALWQIITGRQT